MAGTQQDQALSLLAAANNHGDLAVKLSSLKQAKDILMGGDLSISAELFPYLVELQSSPERLVRKALVETIEEIGLKALEHFSVLMPVLLNLLHDNDSIVARQSIAAGTKIFCIVLDELASQFHRRGIVERWLEELWAWMTKFKDAVFQIPSKVYPLGPKLLAIKFLETCVLLFTSDNDSKKNIVEAMSNNVQMFNISWLVGGHPVLDSAALLSEAYRSFCILLDLLRSASSLPGCITICVVNSLATIGRKRPGQFNSCLSALLDFEPNIEATKGVHTASIQYCLRTAYLGFLRCTYPVILESREKLLRALRAMNAGDAADQVMRQVDKMIRNSERASRLSKDEQTAANVQISVDLMKKRSTPMDQERLMDNSDVASKRTRYGPDTNVNHTVPSSDSSQDYSVTGASPKLSSVDTGLTPVEQMIAMIGALLAEGERGAESLEILIAKIHPDLLADIVITNMKHLPKNLPPLSRHGSLPVTQQSGISIVSSQIVEPMSLAVSSQSPMPEAQGPFLSNTIIPLSSDTTTSTNLPADTKREAWRDPRRLDPRRMALEQIVEGNTSVTQSSTAESQFDASIQQKKLFSQPVTASAESTSLLFGPQTETELHILENSASPLPDQPSLKEEFLDEGAKKVDPDMGFNFASHVEISPVVYVDKDLEAQNSPDIIIRDENRSLPSMELDQLSPSRGDIPVLGEANADLPVVPLFIQLTEEQQRNVRKLAIERIIDSYKQLQEGHLLLTRFSLLARLVAQMSADDEVIAMIQKHIVSHYQHQKGHELVIYILYHLHTQLLSDSVEASSSAAIMYEKFLLGTAKSLLDLLPASDKSFSRLLSEVPFLPDSALKLLDDICYSDNYHGKEGRDVDRVTQGLGSLWSLILGRPLNRQACLDIALKCAVHPKDDIRAKAIRLVMGPPTKFINVANKLYVIDYISDKIEDFATNKFLAAVDKHADLLLPGTSEQRTGEVGNQEASISGSTVSEAETSENNSGKGAQFDSHTDSSMSFAQAQQHLSLFFALCTKKATLLQLVFDKYGLAPKVVKQAIHRHIPILIRALGSSYSQLLHTISDPPQGSENLVTQVVQILSEGTTPSPDLVATVKLLYETKLKDATILIPILSSFTKNEVLPIFPRLVELPLDKFQTALAHILQGSAHMGPALTPAEVLVAIHDINHERDGLPLKKITDACSACFEQRTVFTQQVLAKALNQMVDQTPLPLLFMRTVIQAIDAFPTLVDFVMELLSKLVSKQVWRMPKLWVGFLKCVSQTQPHSFRVLLQLPSQQLEGVLNKYNIRNALAAYANQASIRSSLPRSTLLVLGLTNESNLQQSHLVTSKVHGAT